MPAPHSLCIAIPRLYAKRVTSRNGPDRHPLVPVRSTFVIVVGVKTNRVRERRPRRYPLRRTMRHPAGDTE